MYQHGTRCGVPFLPRGAWTSRNKSDFEAAAELVNSYNHYVSKVGNAQSLGQAINNHMSMYFAWRFRAIRVRMRGDTTERSRVTEVAATFKAHEVELDKEIAVLEQKQKASAAELKALLERREAQVLNSRPSGGKSMVDQSWHNELQAARQKQTSSRDELLKAKARRASWPSMAGLQELISLYDRRLLQDVRMIRDYVSEPGRRAELRPHYKMMLDAYEDEFEKNKGVNDSVIIGFFDDYVHDSLVAFAKDATLPSDPRVIYLGEDKKYTYASVEASQHSSGAAKEFA
jgi:hypothetical protein